ncbi:Uu.00g109500.m01.CDS01 [Anthostomella pinea]|uniref:Uu.00g109500.m01.CDS01 n=1 Tax=Anthostomella pinea TaxID=933095 RepID=A0AAI8YGB3_9PEZI|nr:Uu.00g109500.m01.CDS01 [Anthostomella pinea]
MASDSASLHTNASQETLVSLLQLDPSPMDNDSTKEKELPDLPDEAMESSTSTIAPSSTPTGSSSSLGLSGHGHGPIYYLSRIQRYSSYTFTLFAGLHIANTSVIPLIYRSVPYSEPYLLMARELYQTRLGEPLLVGLPVLAHVASGLAIRLVRRRQNIKRYGGGATPGMWPLNRSKSAASTSSSSSISSFRAWPPLSYISISGYVFAGVLAAHVGMNRVLPLLVDGDSSNIGLQYVSHGFARDAVQSWIAYTILISAGVGHMVWGWAWWMDVAPPRDWRRTTVDRKVRRRRRRVWWGIQGAAVAVAGLWAAGGLGVVARGGAVEGWLGTVYDGIYSYAGQ